MSVSETAVDARPSVGLALGLTLASVVLWGFSPIGTRFMVGHGQQGLPAAAFTAVRYGIALLVLAPLGWRGLRGWTRRDWGLAAVCGFTGVAGYSLPAALGQRTVSAGMTGLLDGAEPLSIILFTAWFTRRRPGGRVLAASAVALAGVVLLARQSGPLLGSPTGIALVLLAAVLWGLYCVIVQPLIARRGVLAVTFAATFWAMLPMLALGAPDLVPTLQGMDAAQWEVTVAMALGTSVAAMLCWNAGSAGLGPARAGWFLYLLPIVSLTGGFLILGEAVKPGELVGGGMILLAVFLAQR